MKILYYNLQLGSFDGSNMHAIGMLDALKSVCGNENVVIANNYAQSTYNHKQDQLKLKLSRFLKPFRILRRNILTNKSLKSILVKVKEQEFQPDYVLARSVLYDKTPVLLAQALKCKLIIEHNTPFVYECCTILKTETKLSVRNFES